MKRCACQTDIPVKIDTYRWYAAKGLQNRSDKRSENTRLGACSRSLTQVHAPLIPPLPNLRHVRPKYLTEQRLKRKKMHATTPASAAGLRATLASPLAARAVVTFTRL